MTLVRTGTGVVGLISKVAAEDEGAAGQLISLGIYETLRDLEDFEATEQRSAMNTAVLKRSDEGRRALVRSFIDRRTTGDDVDDVLKAAEMMTTVELVAKAERDRKGFWHDNLGRFTSGSNTATSGLRLLGGDKSRSQSAVALGQAMGASSPLGQAIAAAGALGPEAERVLGPGLQRTAYRFRGTERRPNQALHNAVNDHQEPLGARDAEYTRRGFTPDQRRLAVRGDAVAAYFAAHLPKQADAELSYASGRVPPSRGAIIDADGDVITEAVGLNGDHYVPFDLKNLARMEGGQYVRTRAAGGPTREDLYAGLMGGARQVQVVSHSGVFTLELDPDLRGGRRYSDKARQMTNRYQEILQTIADEKVAAVPLSDAQMGEVRRRALAQAGGDVGAAKKKLPELVSEEMQRLAYSRNRAEDEAEVNEAVQHRVAAEERKAGGFSTQERARIARDIAPEVRAQLAEETPRALRLDGEGYARALNALQGEFPYFIRDVRHEQLREFGEQMGLRNVVQSLPARAGSDKGFVRAGNNLAVASRSSDRAVRSRDMKPGGKLVPTDTESKGEKPATTRDGAAPRSAGSTESTDHAGVPYITNPKITPSPSIADLMTADAAMSMRLEAGKSLSDLDRVADSIVELADVDIVESQTGPGYLNWLVRDKGSGRGGEAVHYLLTKASPAVRQKTIQAIGDTVDQAHTQTHAPARLQQIMDTGDELTRLISLADAPAAATAEAVLKPPSDEDRALGFKQIDGLGTSIKNFDAWHDQATALDPQGLGAFLKEFERGDPKKIVQQRALRLSGLKTYLSDPEKNESVFKPKDIAGPEQARDEVMRLEKELPLRHLAWAYQDRRTKVDSLLDQFSLGQEGEQSPDPIELAEKRHAPTPRLVRYPPGSDVSKAYRAALFAQQRR